MQRSRAADHLCAGGAVAGDAGGLGEFGEGVGDKDVETVAGNEDALAGDGRVVRRKSGGGGETGEDEGEAQRE